MMWFMNKILNPFVRLILRSPLHGMLSGALLLITYQGRKSGRLYTLPVQYVQSGDVIYIAPGAPSRKTWWRNLRGGAPVQIRLRGQPLRGKATALSGQADAGLVAQALNLYLQRFPAAARLRSVRLASDGGFDQQDVQRAALSTLVVRVDLERGFTSV